MRRPVPGGPGTRRLGLRWLMLGPVLLIVGLGFALLSVYVVRTAQSNLVAGMDDELQRARAGQATRQGASDGSPGRVAEGTRDDSTVERPVQLVVNGDGTVVVEGPAGNPFTATALAELADTRGTVTIEGEPRYRALVTSRANGRRAVTALSMAQVDASVASLRTSLLLGGLVVFGICSVVVWWIATLVARPVTRMAQVASRIAGGALDTPIDQPPGGSREVAALASDMQAMVDQLSTTIADREEQTTAATESRDAMRRFLADASHELRTPLTALTGYSDLYRHRMLAEPADLDRAMGRIGSESRRLTRLVNGMLQLAREVPADRTPMADVDLRQIAVGVVEDLCAAFPDHSIELTAPPSAEPTVVHADPDLLHQAVLNLGANACQHNPPGVAVTVHVATTGTTARLSVIDHGQGIDPQHIDKIFTPLYRADSSRTRANSAGAGLGLALTEQIVTAHDGTITHEPTPHGGATFRIEIPTKHSP
ncbi:MAG: sensor histidine kinase [Nocardioides sp.]